MVDNETFRVMALQFDNIEEQPHFHRKAFRVKGKTIFATLDEAEQTANLKLSEADQSVFCLIDKQNIYPVQNAWGKKGWTSFQLRNIPKRVVKDGLRAAYTVAASKK